MPCYYGTHFNGEFVGGAGEFVEAEIEHSEAGVPVDSVDDVTSALVAYLTVGQVQLAKRRPVENNELAHDGGSFE